jgi:dTDP-D-glucose 4,6-dehydratase
MINFWGKGKMKTMKNNNFYERKHLRINSTKAKKNLNWLSTYDIKNTVRITTEWYLKVLKKGISERNITDQQIENYMNENNWS